MWAPIVIAIIGIARLRESDSGQRLLVITMDEGSPRFQAKLAQFYNSMAIC